MTPQQLTAARNILNLSQERLAEAMGYSGKQSISLKERGERAITPRDQKILKRLLQDHAKNKKTEEKLLHRIIESC